MIYSYRFLIDYKYEIIKITIYSAHLIALPMKTLDDMQLFVKVVELKSFTAAADNLDISRGLLSRRISSLEERLGVRLLNRTTRKLDLTESGSTYFQYCRKVIDTALEAEEAIMAIKTDPVGLLRVAMPILFGQDIFAPLLSEFRSRYPRIKLLMDLTDQPADLVGSGYDLVVRWGMGSPDSSYIARTLGRMRIITCAAPAYLENFGEPRELSDLQSRNCLIYSPLRQGEEIWRFEVDGEFQDLPVTGDIEANHATLLVQAAIAGLGILYAPAFFVEEQLASGELVELFRDYRLSANIWAEYPHRMITRKERAFLDFLSEKVPAAVIGVLPDD